MGQRANLVVTMSYKKIALWSPPRSVSTAFLRIFKERSDFTIFNEAFCDLATIGKYQSVHLNKELNEQSELIALLQQYAKRSHVFFKETCEVPFAHLFKEREFFQDVMHTFLVREPKATINSHYAMNNDVTCEEIGFQNLLQVLEFVREELKQEVIVIDAQDLIESPEHLMRAYCEKVGIAFDMKAMSWQPGDIPEWQRTKAWHKDVSQSSGIHKGQRQYEVNVDNNDKLAEFYQYHLPIYQQIMQYKLSLVEQASESVTGSNAIKA